MCNTKQQTDNIMNTPCMIPDEKSALYSDKYHRSQVFKNQFQNEFQNSLQNQLTCFLNKAIESIKKTSNKRHRSQDQRHQQTHDTNAEERDSDVIVQSSESDQPREQHWYTNDTMWKIVV